VSRQFRGLRERPQFFVTFARWIARPLTPDTALEIPRQSEGDTPRATCRVVACYMQSRTVVIVSVTLTISESAVRSARRERRSKKEKSRGKAVSLVHARASTGGRLTLVKSRLISPRLSWTGRSSLIIFRDSATLWGSLLRGRRLYSSTFLKPFRRILRSKFKRIPTRRPCMPLSGLTDVNRRKIDQGHVSSKSKESRESKHVGQQQLSKAIDDRLRTLADAVPSATPSAGY